jgi:hypothetical protein
VKPWVLLILLIPALVACKPQRARPTAYRVSVAEALADRSIVGLDKEKEALVAAEVGPDLLTVGELVRVLQTLPVVSRYFYSETHRAELFLKEYLMLNLAAREGLSQLLWKNPHSRGALLAAQYRQEKDDWLAAQVSAAGRTPAEVATQRQALWQAHLSQLRETTPVTVDEQALAAFEGQFQTQRSSQ